MSAMAYQQRGQPQMMMMAPPQFQSRGPMQNNLGTLGRRITEFLPIDYRSETEDDAGERIAMNEQTNCEIMVVAMDHKYKGMFKMGKKDLIVGSWFLSGGGSKHQRALERSELIPHVLDLRCCEGKFQEYLQALMSVNERWMNHGKSDQRSRHLVTTVPEYLARQTAAKQALNQAKLERRLTEMKRKQKAKGVVHVDIDSENSEGDEVDKSGNPAAGAESGVSSSADDADAPMRDKSGTTRKSCDDDAFDLVVGLRVAHNDQYGMVSRLEKRDKTIAVFVKHDADGSEIEITPEALRVALLACYEVEFVDQRLAAVEEKVKAMATPMKVKLRRAGRRYVNETLGELPNPLANLLGKAP